MGVRPVWTLIYPMVAVAGWLAWREGRSRGGTLVYLLQLTLNAAWPWIFFGERRLGWALVCVVALFLATLLTIAAFWRVHRGAAVLLWPYLGWIAFSGTLTAAIWWRN